MLKNTVQFLDLKASIWDKWHLSNEGKMIYNKTKFKFGITYEPPAALDAACSEIRTERSASSDPCS